MWVSFITDVRQMTGSGLRLPRAAAGSLGGALLSQLVYGAFCAALIVILPNVFAASTIYYSLLLATLGLALLVDFTSVVLSPDDHAQLAPRPIDSRTFFVARLTSVVGFSLLLTMPFALLPALAYLFRDGGGSLAAAIASVAAAATCAVLVPLVVILLFLALVQVIPAGRLHRALGYVQFFLSFVFIGAFFLLSRTTRALDTRAAREDRRRLPEPRGLVRGLDRDRGRPRDDDRYGCRRGPARAAGRGWPPRARSPVARVCRTPGDDVRGSPGQFREPPPGAVPDLRSCAPCGGPARGRAVPHRPEVQARCARHPAAHDHLPGRGVQRRGRTGGDDARAAARLLRRPLLSGDASAVPRLQ